MILTLNGTYRCTSSQSTFWAVLTAVMIWMWSSPGPAAARHFFFPQVRDRIKQQVAAGIQQQGFSCRGEIICGLKVIPVFYQERNYAPVWFGIEGLHPAARILVQTLREVEQEGLVPSDYHLKAIERLLAELSEGPFPPDESKAVKWADLDLILTDAYLMLGSHLSGGRINPENLHADWLINPRSYDMPAVLNAAAAAEQMINTLYRLRPVHAGYTKLLAALHRMRLLKARGEWPRFEGKRTLRPDDVDPRVSALRRRMTISGDLKDSAPPEQPDLYDQDLASAVKAFQNRHGLAPDGAIGRKTRQALNVTITQRIRQIELNLERWRWMPRDLGDRYIIINTAAFFLRVMENHKKVMEMKVVVGRPARQSPAFSATMTYMVFNPYWNVPYTIAVQDILPKLADGVDYLIDNGFKVFSGWGDDARELDPLEMNWNSYTQQNFPLRLRQEPGKKNALGQIKFMFPNKFAVYLHDTPQRSLFNEVQRDFSSGCIRVEDARSLAAYLLSDKAGWSRQRLLKALETGMRQVVHVPNPITIHLNYMTAWVDENGHLQFREDIYQRDRQLDDALRHRSPYALPPLMSPQGRLLKLEKVEFGALPGTDRSGIQMDKIGIAIIPYAS